MEDTTVSGPEISPKTEVFYDAACPLCRWEIDTYRKLDGARAVDWVDANSLASDAFGPELTRRQALARFHVRTKEGALLEGGRAFAYLWLQMPRTRWLGALFSRPPFLWLIVGAYPVFLRCRPVLQAIARKRARARA